MLAAHLLAKKRDGQELSDDEIRFLIQGFCRGEVADYQMSALAMAICLKGMTSRETTTLTRAMLESGDRLPRSVSGDTPRVDKHSTGGLGDKISLVLAPLLASCGVHVPMISGRGLGITGGTLDKLESIDGFQCDVDLDQSDKILRQVGAFIVSASASIAPADRRLYALRDVTGTIESIPLITGSILSKKLAASLDALVMDVKVGNAAFMKTRQDAKNLGLSLEAVGRQAGLPTQVVISDMDQPLGRAIGNAIEVNEAVEVLGGSRTEDPMIERVRELTLALCEPLLTNVKVAENASIARQMLIHALDSGTAMERFEMMVLAQGGNWKGALPLAPKCEVKSPQSGYVKSIDGPLLGRSIVEMGGGRRKVGDQIDHTVGIEMRVQIGDWVDQGQPLLTIHVHKSAQSDYVRRLQSAVGLTEEFVPARPVILNCT